VRAILLAVLVTASLAGCDKRDEFDAISSASGGPARAGWRPLPVAIDRSGGSFLSTTAVWAGDRLVVIHGADGQSDNIVGEVYDLHRGLVLSTTSPLPWGDHVTVWTGTEVIVRGGGAVQEAATDTAGYDPVRDRWRRLARSPAPGPGSAVWTGREMLAFGADNELLAYDPVTDRWTRGPRSPLAGRWRAASAWTGRELLVWGGCRVDDPWDCTVTAADGAAYDPSTRQWRLLPPAPIEGLGGTGTVWTGSEMIVWGGVSSAAPGGSTAGAAYDPSADRWRALPAAPLSGRTEHVMVWTGYEVLVWDGATAATGGGLAGDGARYDPISNRWTPMPPVPPGVIGPGLRRAGAGTWTPFGLVVTGGYPAADTWLLTSPSNRRAAGPSPGGVRPCRRARRCAGG
jgi:hypothetical protein